MQHYFQRLDRLIAADGRITIPKKETADRLAKILNDRDLESLKMKLPFVSWIYEIERGT